MPAKKKAESVARVEVVLKLPHTHQGEDKKPGDKISVTESQQAWLAKRNII